MGATLQSPGADRICRATSYPSVSAGRFDDGHIQLSTLEHRKRARAVFRFINIVPAARNTISDILARVRIVVRQEDAP